MCEWATQCVSRAATRRSTVLHTARECVSGQHGVSRAAAM
jgi:hypothetical protein